MSTPIYIHHAQDLSSAGRIPGITLTDATPSSRTNLSNTSVSRLSAFDGGSMYPTSGAGAAAVSPASPSGLLHRANISPARSSSAAAAAAISVNATSNSGSVTAAGTGDFHSAAAAVSDLASRIRDDGLHKDRLLRDAQQQVRDLLTHKEQSSAQRAEIALLQERLRAKETEVDKLHKMLIHEREDREGTIRALTEKLHAANVAAESRARRVEDKAREVQDGATALQREVERKTEQLRALEREQTMADRILAEERERHEQTKIELTRAKSEVMRLESKCEEIVRNGVKSDASRATLLKQLETAEKELARLRDDHEQTRRRKDELLIEQTQLRSQRDALMERVNGMSVELEQVPRLRQEITLLSAAREELVGLRQSLNDTDLQIANERSQRRTLELEREQFQLSIRSLEADMKRMEGELHRAQCDAAEKATLRRELEETKDSLEVSHRTVMDLQSQLAALRDELSRHLNKHESFHTAVSTEFALLRSGLEAAIYQTALTSSNNNNNNNGSSATIGDESAITSNEASDVSHASSTAPPAARNGRASRSVLSTLTQHALLPSCEALFTPTRAAVLEVATVIAEERSRKNNLQRLVEVEHNNNSGLQESLRNANATINSLHIRLAESTAQCNDLTTRLQEQQTRANRAEATIAENLTQLAAIFGEAAAGGNWEVVQRSAARITAEAQQLSLQCDRLNRELATTTSALASERQGRAADATAAEAKRTRQVADLELTHSQRMSEATNLQTSLKDALAKAAQRNEDVLKDLAKLQSSYESTLRSLQESQRRGEELEARLRSAETVITQKDAALQGKNDDIEALQDSVAERDAKLEKAARKASELATDLEREKAEAAAEHECFLLFARAIFGLRQALRSALAERNAVLQLSHALDQALRIIAADAPEVVKPRRTLRVAVIAVLAHNRLTKMLQAARAARMANFSPASSPTRNGGAVVIRRGGRANDIPLPVIAHVGREDLRFTRYDDEHDTLFNILAQIENFEPKPEVVDAAVRQQLRKKPSSAAFAISRRVAGASGSGEGASLLQRIGSVRARSAANVGPVALARTVSRMYSIRLQDTIEQQRAQERQLNAVRSENSSLVATIQAKEEQNQRFSKQIGELISQTSNMVDRRVHEGVEQELVRVRSKLQVEKTDKELAEERIAAMQAREMKLLAQQNQLQNEARTLAIELAVSRSTSPQNPLGSDSFGGHAVPLPPALQPSAFTTIGGGSSGISPRGQYRDPSPTFVLTPTYGGSGGAAGVAAAGSAGAMNSGAPTSFDSDSDAGGSVAPSHVSASFGPLLKSSLNLVAEARAARSPIAAAPPRSAVLIDPMASTLPPGSSSPRAAAMSSSSVSNRNLMAMIRQIDERISGALEGSTTTPSAAAAGRTSYAQQQQRSQQYGGYY